MPAPKVGRRHKAHLEPPAVTKVRVPDVQKGRRHYPRVVPPPVARVPDVVRDKGVILSRSDRRALKARQGFLLFDLDGVLRSQQERRQ